MFCPKCKDEFIKGIEACPDCEVPLVDTLPPEEKQEFTYVELVTVLSGDMSAMMVAKSILEDAGIKYFAKGEHLQNLFGWGRIGSGYNMIVGAVQLQVAKEDEETAMALLEKIR